TAYKEAAKEALTNATIIERTVDDFYRIEFGYEIMSDVMNFIKQHQLEVVNQTLEEKGIIEFRIRQRDAETIVEQLESIDGLQISFLGRK
ncbi:MAG: YigZ family protein, partial [Flavobacteriales bacterium]|nr:YigZ family protein [Flavobacteriales bacterium]